MACNTGTLKSSITTRKRRYEGREKKSDIKSALFHLARAKHPRHSYLFLHGWIPGTRTCLCSFQGSSGLAGKTPDPTAGRGREPSIIAGGTEAGQEIEKTTLPYPPPQVRETGEEGSGNKIFTIHRLLHNTIQYTPLLIYFYYHIETTGNETPIPVQKSTPTPHSRKKGIRKHNPRLPSPLISIAHRGRKVAQTTSHQVPHLTLPWLPYEKKNMQYHTRKEKIEVGRYGVVHRIPIRSISLHNGKQQTPELARHCVCVPTLPYFRCSS